MSDEVLPPNDEKDLNNAKIVYVLYLLSIIVGVTGMIGVIMAYVYRQNAPVWVQSHYQFQIRTFWIGLIYLFAGTFLILFLVGWLVLMFWVVWLSVRCVKGLSLLDQKRAHPNPTSWWF